MYVFVYGTLKSGEPNHHWMTDAANGVAEFRWNGKTVVKYPLVIASQYNIPFLVDVPGTGHKIHGEVYEINEQKLSHLDILENYPILYTRRLELIEIHGEGNDTEPITREAWVYFLTSYKPQLLEKPHIDNYSSSGPHALRYVSKYDRVEEPNDIDV